MKKIVSIVALALVVNFTFAQNVTPNATETASAEKGRSSMCIKKCGKKCGKNCPRTGDKKACASSKKAKCCKAKKSS